MSLLGQVVLYELSTGGTQPRAAIVANADTEPMLTLHVFLHTTDSGFATSPLLVVRNVPYEASGHQGTSWHFADNSQPDVQLKNQAEWAGLARGQPTQ